MSYFYIWSGFFAYDELTDKKNRRINCGFFYRMGALPALDPDELAILANVPRIGR